MLFFLFVWYFNIIARSALFLLFSSRACLCFLVVFFCYAFLLYSLLSFLRLCLYCLVFYVCDCFCAVFGQCRTPKTATRATHSRTAARGRPAGLSCFSCLPLLSVHTVLLCAGIACRGIDHRPPGVLFRYGLTRGKSQIGLAHPQVLLFRDKNKFMAKRKL